MKRLRCLMLTVCLLSGMLAGCGSVDSDSTIVSVGKKGMITTIDVEDFEQDYYTEEDFKAFAEDAINTYNMSHEVDAVTLSEFTVTDGVAKLKMEFKSAEDYAGFNGIPLFQGTIVDAVAAGYKFEGTFSAVEKGEVTGSATKTEILADADLKVVIIQANTDVQVAGKICFVSNQNVTVTAKDIVSIRDAENLALESEVLTYIVYK